MRRGCQEASIEGSTQATAGNSNDDDGKSMAEGYRGQPGRGASGGSDPTSYTYPPLSLQPQHEQHQYAEHLVRLGGGGGGNKRSREDDHLNGHHHGMPELSRGASMTGSEGTERGGMMHRDNSAGDFVDADDDEAGGGKDDDGKGAKKMKPKTRRSRAACEACKSTKQKCDGPSKIPCRRCQLYGLECKFPGGIGMSAAPSSSSTATASTSNLPPLSIPLPTASTPGGGSAVGAQAEERLSRKLDKIYRKLETLERSVGGAALNSLRRGSLSTLLTSREAGVLGGDMSDSSYFSDDEGGERRPKPYEPAEVFQGPGTLDPVAEITESIKQVKRARLDPAASNAQMQYTHRPDVIDAGILSAPECQELFDFFFTPTRGAGWTMMLALPEDRIAMAVRARSPLLFHAILSVATSYDTPFPSASHEGVVSMVNAIVAPILLNPQPHELNTDFLRAMDLFLLYKPVQIQARRLEGKTTEEAMTMSKVNGLSSWIINCILTLTVEKLDLASILRKFDESYRRRPHSPIPKDVLADMRLYFWLLSNDVQGSMQSGNRCRLDGSAAMAITRNFASLNLAPTDTRLASSVEMYEIARAIVRSEGFEKTRRIHKAELEKFNELMAAWERHWIPILLRSLPQDPLAMTVLCPFSYFVSVTLNASAYTHWKASRRHLRTNRQANNHHDSSDEVPTSSVSGSEGQQESGLNNWEWTHLEKAVRAAEALIFTLSVESRAPGGWRRVAWAEAERADGYRKLVLDDKTVGTHRYAIETVVVIAYMYPLVFLSRLANEGLLTENLELLMNPLQQAPWKPQQKLPRLLELGAAFLSALSDSNDHPCKSQAAIVRKLYDAGMQGPGQPPPESPRPPSAAPLLHPNMLQRHHSAIDDRAPPVSYAQAGMIPAYATPTDAWAPSIYGGPGAFVGQQALSDVLSGFDLSYLGREGAQMFDNDGGYSMPPDNGFGWAQFPQ